MYKKVSVEIAENITYSKHDQNLLLAEMIKKSFKNLELDEKNYDTDKWNPLGDNLIKKGDIVLIKPNMVLEKNLLDLGEECLYTNVSVVAAIIPYVIKALDGKGKIIIADAPVQSCDFGKMIKNSGYKDLVEFYRDRNINIELRDLRGLISRYDGGVLKQKVLDDENAVLVDLGKDSEHSRLNNSELNKLRITNYNPDELLKHHNSEKHEYLIAKEVLDADVIINMPKPKAHRKAGITGGMKNFIGVNVRKEYLPHHRLGDVNNGGDEYERASWVLRKSSKLYDDVNCLRSKGKYKKAELLALFSKICSGIDKRLISKEKNREGSWYGNATLADFSNSSSLSNSCCTIYF